MNKLIMPGVLIGVAVAIFFMLADPLYQKILLLKETEASYNEALNNAKTLDIERDKLTAKDNTISKDDRNKLEEFLPDNQDNIRLILEVEKIASPYSMIVKDVRYSTMQNKPATGGTPTAPVQGSGALALNKDYGAWDLEFSTEGTYSDFINFTKGLESNLRIVDISSVQFSSNANKSTNSSTGSGASGSESYKYDFKIKAYWLRN